MAKRLLLWDIDGTLVTFAAPSRQIYFDALSEVAGSAVIDTGITMGGKTDPTIVREILLANEQGVDAEALDGLVRRGLRAIGRHSADRRDFLRSHGTVLSGVPAVLERMQHKDHVNTVVTGNIAVNAVLKLQLLSLSAYFDLEVGGFGSDSEVRSKLVEIAMDRVGLRRNRHFGMGETWVIGDTPADYAAAAEHDIRCLLVATGHYGFEELSKVGAEAVLPDLSDVDAVERILLSD